MTLRRLPTKPRLAAPLAVAAAVALTVAAAAHAGNPRAFARQMDKANRSILGYPKAHTVCRNDNAAGQQGRYICAINLGRPNDSITLIPAGVQCLRGEFWPAGGHIKVSIASITVIRCSQTGAPSA